MIRGVVNTSPSEYQRLGGVQNKWRSTINGKRFRALPTESHISRKDRDLCTSLSRRSPNEDQINNLMKLPM
ncbi:hypothetical protein B5X24_HaOG209730 [Helicoverpa armigera]|uniref:Uncharacterized protein n=1 Tax=Helicoverpa armigera TaxID=29058 RepID=A0A2W1BEM3_HELAM|nr:hypothetical protein B5X24_HaOG209730 [Helicoverpa armigera]